MLDRPAHVIMSIYRTLEDIYSPYTHFKERLGPMIADRRDVHSTVSTPRQRMKATWGLSFLALAAGVFFVFAPGVAQAQGPAQHRREKLDPKLTQLATQGAGESNVIIEFND